MIISKDLFILGDEYLTMPRQDKYAVCQASRRRNVVYLLRRQLLMPRLSSALFGEVNEWSSIIFNPKFASNFDVLRTYATPKSIGNPSAGGWHAHSPRSTPRLQAPCRTARFFRPCTGLWRRKHLPGNGESAGSVSDRAPGFFASRCLAPFREEKPSRESGRLAPTEAAELRGVGRPATFALAAATTGESRGTAPQRQPLPPKH
ncbi:unnamed protein product, partial [Ixodes persulcatus]